MPVLAASRLSTVWLTVGACVAFNTLASAVEADRPQVLFTWLMDVDVPPDSRGGAVDVLAQSWVFLNEATLAQIDPAIADVDQMPLVTVQLFGDIAFTAQVTSARSLWMDVEPWNDEAGVENPPDAFILSADILAPEIGYLVLHSSAEGVFARVHIDGEGSFDLAPDKGTLYIARRITSTNEFECLTDAQAGADGSDEGGVAGSDCPGTAPACTATCDHGCTLDCVILFTTAAKDEATAENKNIRTEILLAIEEANQAFEDSEIDDGVRVISMQQGSANTANGACDNPSVSFDGAFIAFESEADNLLGAGNDTNGYADVFRRSRGNSTTLRFSQVNGAGQAMGGDSTDPAITRDGVRCVFQSKATNLTGTSDTDGYWDIYLRDVVAATTSRLSVSTGGTQGNGHSQSPSMTVLDDGTILVAFQSAATNLDSDNSDSDTDSDIYLYAKPASGSPSTILISQKSDGSSPNGASTQPSISADGRFIAFVSTSTDIIAGLSGAVARVFVYDRAKDTTFLVSRELDGDPVNAACRAPAISSQARFVAFECTDTDLVASDANGSDSDIFIRDVGPRGDLNGDGLIDTVDRDILDFNWGVCPCCAADLDADGDVDEDDLDILEDNATD